MAHKRRPRNEDKPWSERDDEQLIALAHGSLSVEAIAKRLRRTPDEVTKRAASLNIGLRIVRPKPRRQRTHPESRSDV